MRILVAGFGNVLRCDDGFGPAVAQLLADDPPPAGVTVLDAGIGGIHVVQELLGGVDALVAIDAVEVDRPPGTVVVVAPDVADLAAQGGDALADMHYANPDRALGLARGLGVLPAVALVVGCQPVDADGVGLELSAAVRAAVPVAAAEVRRVVTDLGIPWERDGAHGS